MTGAGVGAAVAAEVGGRGMSGPALGKATAARGDGVGAAGDAGPVVMGGRPAGPTEPVYGTPGGAVTLADHGCRFAGDLPAAKARVGLALGLAAGVDRRGIDRLFGRQ